MYLYKSAMDDIRLKFPILNEWINDYIFNKRSRRLTILDYIMCTSHEDTTSKPSMKKPNSKMTMTKNRKQTLKFILQNELIFQLSEV